MNWQICPENYPLPSVLAFPKKVRSSQSTKKMVSEFLAHSFKKLAPIDHYIFIQRMTYGFHILEGI
jgi:hypothetical protein